MKLDLNCDLGEGEPLSDTRGLMRWITSANVACGGHAGDWRTMDKCVRLAKRLGVRLGAHPGPWSRGDFGRGKVALTPDEFELLLLQQVGALEKMAGRHQVKLHHIKLHGGLYHASEEHRPLARRYVQAVRRWWPRCIVYVRAGGRVAGLARTAGLQVWEEVFLDRNYGDDGALVPRAVAGALIEGVQQVRERVAQLLRGTGLRAVSGRALPLHPKTLCIHGDTTQAVRFAREAARILRCR